MRDVIVQNHGQIPTFRIPFALRLAVALACLALFWNLNLQFSTLHAQGTAFSYQGQLLSNNVPVNGAYQMSFTLFDAPTNGTDVAGTIFLYDVPVSNGLFTVTLDFGAGVFTGTNYWLLVAAATNRAPTFTSLNPRQQVTPTPYSVFAESAGSVMGVLGSGALSGTYSGAVNFTNPGSSFTGNGSGLTSVNATTLDGYGACALPCYWNLVGNSGTTPGMNFVGTTDNQALELHADSLRALRLEPDTSGYGAPNVIGGAPVNYVAPGTIGATIAGGGATNAHGILGSLPVLTNTVAANFGTIGGGAVNSIQAGSPYSTIAGGAVNTIQGTNSASAIAGGSFNTIQTNDLNAFIGGGFFNNIGPSLAHATIGGGAQNTMGASSSYATIAGGQHNTIGSNCLNATIAGGSGNETLGPDAFVGGGIGNEATTTATVSGGDYNFGWGIGSFIGGGGYDGSTQAGNTNEGDAAVIGGGLGNSIGIYVPYSFIGGGEFNDIGTFASGATVPGGVENGAGGSNSFAAGFRAQALYHGDFVWADDSTLNYFFATTPDEFSIRAEGGVRIQSGVGVHLNATNGAPDIVRDWDVFGSNASAQKAGVGRWGLFQELQHLVLGIPNDHTGWVDVATYDTNGNFSIAMQVDQSGNITNAGSIYAGGNVYAHEVLLSSDRNAKENFTRCDPQSVLAQVAALPVTEWNYKGDAMEQKHIGPMAQDFHAAFGLNGQDDTHISSIDESGVALAAIQGLNQKIEEKTETIQEQAAEINNLKSRLKKIEELLAPRAPKVPAAGKPAPASAPGF